MNSVLVSGVFNVLHPGHVRLLRFAKECGDYLIVAVQSDSRANQPVHVNEKLRLEGVSCNAYVDEAFISDEKIEELVQRLRPNILVKGKDQENELHPEEELLNVYGGELLFESGEASFSSLDLLRKEFQHTFGINIHLLNGYSQRQGIDTDRLLLCLERFSALKVLVVGDLIMDEYIICDPLGMSQEDPTIVVTPIESQLFLGGAGIVAAHAASLGAKVDFISVSGDDEMRAQALALLLAADIQTELLVDSHRPTTLKQRYRSRGKTLLRVSHLHQSDISQKLQQNLVDRVEEVIDDIDLLVFSDFNYGCLTDYVVKEVTEMASRYGLKIAADSQSSSQTGDVSRFNGVDLLTPTEREARIAMRDHTSGLVVLAEQLRNKTGAENILLKLADEGVLIHASHINGANNGVAEEAPFLTDRVSALNENPKDVAGAGDSMLITAGMTLATGGTIWDAALLGSMAAGLQVGRLGNKPLEMSELRIALSE